ncbi:MAG: class I SAM-dependent rRNA methyltransferase [Bacteroidetes bacterium]|nr:class I SAM-dependent rRNA methyltransferase [Bacteroidota bacterium]
MEKLFIKRNHDKRIKEGHLWIFSNELESIPDLPSGSIVGIYTSNHTNLGLGFYNPHSLIAVRLLKTYSTINTDFFLERFKSALELRKRLNNTEICRLVFGESDLLPGLIVDKYGDYLSIQILSAGMENFTDSIIEAILKVLPETKGIIAKNNSKLRVLEGLPLEEKVLFMDIPDEIITKENGINLSISLKQSQKTGYFLDQTENRKFIMSISKDLNVLDCYCNQGGFALHSAQGHAKEIICIDSSNTALVKAKRNAELNSFNNINFFESDVPEFFSRELSRDSKWDLIILDPPAFAKSKKDVRNASKGYAKINRLALQLLSEGGFLSTSSCSHHITEETFYEIIIREAVRLNIQLRLIHRGSQAPDHPALASMPETKYLKFFAFQKM